MPCNFFVWSWLKELVFTKTNQEIQEKLKRECEKL